MMNYEKLTKAELIELLLEAKNENVRLEKDLDVAYKGVRIKDKEIIELKDQVEHIKKEQEVIYNTEKKVVSEQVRILQEELQHLSQGLLELDFMSTAFREKNMLDEKIINGFYNITRRKYVQNKQEED